METHVFDQANKRLIPLSKKCAFCYEGSVTEDTSCHYIPIYKEADRTNIVVYRSVKYAQMEVGIPCCTECQSVHEAAASQSTLWAWGIGLGIFFLAVIIGDPIIGIIGLVLSLGVGFWAQSYLKQKFILDAGKYVPQEVIEGDDMIQDFMLRGWTLTPPQA